MGYTFTNQALIVGVAVLLTRRPPPPLPSHNLPDARTKRGDIPSVRKLVIQSVSHQSVVSQSFSFHSFNRLIVTDRGQIYQHQAGPGVGYLE